MTSTHRNRRPPGVELLAQDAADASSSAATCQPLPEASES